MTAFRYTAEEHAWMKENIPGRSYKEIAELFSKKFRPITSEQARTYCKNKKIPTGRTGRFVKGQPSRYKGLKQTDFLSPEAIEKTKATRFKKGDRPHNTKPIGSERNLIGYIEVKVAEPNVWKMKHRILWEQHHGPIPEGHKILFRDGDPMNITIENLEMVDNATNCRMAQLGLHHVSPENFDTAVLIGKLATEIGKKKKRR